MNVRVIYRLLDKFHIMRSPDGYEHDELTVSVHLRLLFAEDNIAAPASVRAPAAAMPAP